jgi:hypothetical protein
MHSYQSGPKSAGVLSDEPEVDDVSRGLVGSVNGLDRDAPARTVEVIDVEHLTRTNRSSPLARCHSSCSTNGST